MSKFTDRLQHAWSVFTNSDPPNYTGNSVSYLGRQDRIRLGHNNEKNVVAAIYNRIAVDIMQIDIEHVRVDENKVFKEKLDSGLSNCLSVSANIDQTGRALIKDIAMSLFDEGVVAVVPVDTSMNPKKSGSYNILSMRTGKIVQWYPQHVKIRLYNDKTGRKQDIVLNKKNVAIIENPFYEIMNQPNSTLKRLIKILNLVDYVNGQSGSDKLNMIIQLPYLVKTDSRRAQAEKRRSDLEQQLTTSRYGIAYTDGTEKIIQLNRSLDNNLWAQAKELTSMLYNQLGLTESVFNGTASESEMINYFNRTIDPILTAIADEFKRKFLTANARTRGESILYFRDLFKLSTVSQIADAGDKMSRNEILTPNEIRAEMGFKPSGDPRSDTLQNRNMPVQDENDNQNERQANYDYVKYLIGKDTNITQGEIE